MESKYVKISRESVNDWDNLGNIMIPRHNISFYKLLKKRQNIDFLKEKQNKEELGDVNNLKDRLKSLIQEYNTLLIKDKTEANKLYIEEIIDIKKEIFNLENKWLEVITDENEKHYLYLPEKYLRL